MRLADGRRLVELASGVDALYLSGVSVVPSGLFTALKSARDQARETRRPTPVVVGEQEFGVSPSGLGRYAIRLEHPHGVVGLTDSSKLPAVRVQLRATYLHGVGVDEALRWFQSLLERVLGPVVWKVSRIDLFVDVQGWSLVAADRSRFVCRARECVTYDDDGQLTGFGFGKRSTGTVSARIYDKTHEVATKGNDWWLDIWGANYDLGQRVLRVEFEIGRELIRQTGLDDPASVIEARGGLWGYCTDDWLTFRDRTNDATKARWPVGAEWEQIRAATLRSHALGLSRVYAGEHAGSMRILLPGLRGYLSSAGALLGATSLGETLRGVEGALLDDERTTGVSFASRIAEKRAGADAA